MGKLEFFAGWMGEQWEGFEVTGNHISWRIGSKISENCCVQYANCDSEKDMAEAHAVYHCEQMKEGKPTGTNAIIKVRMQIPPDSPPSLDPAVREKLADDQPVMWALIEIASLKYFNQKRCKVVPRLLDVIRSRQEGPSMPVPKGYLLFVLLEKVPGVPLNDFWSYDPPKRDKIRASFRRGLMELLSLGARPNDCKRDNLVYDETTDTCYFVDLESIPVREDKPPLEFDDDDYFFWGLAYSSYGEDFY